MKMLKIRERVISSLTWQRVAHPKISSLRFFSSHFHSVTSYRFNITGRSFNHTIRIAIPRCPAARCRNHGSHFARCNCLILLSSPFKCYDTVGNRVTPVPPILKRLPPISGGNVENYMIHCERDATLRPTRTRSPLLVTGSRNIRRTNNKLFAMSDMVRWKP